MSRARRLFAALLVSALWASAAAPATAATLFDPALKFRALATAHFVIYFHQGEDRLAQRLARVAEDAWQALRLPLGVTPPPRTHVVLADQTELFNGYATPLPYDTIVIYPVAPSGASFNFDDWLRLVFTHEFTHIVHLDRSEGWARRIRSVFGRAPYAFPNLFLPAWQIEGLATYEETTITGEGRAHAGDFRAIVGEAARQHRLEPLDRVNGGLTDWPGGNAVYAYGEGFHQYLADRFGADTLAALATATARRAPFLASGAFTKVYGESLGMLWREYEDSVARTTTAPPSDPAITRLTHQGFAVSGPRFDRYGDDVLYSAVNPQGFPALYRIGLAGGEPHHVTRRYLGSTTGPGRDRVYFDQVEQHRSIGLYSDLYSWSRADGRVRRLTNGARLQDPDLSPDGGTLVCVQNRPGQRDLVLVSIVRLESRATGDAAHDFSRAITILLAEPDTQFDAPKWSPDGQTIAVQRHRLGAMPDIAIVDVATRAVHVIASAANTRVVTPAWRPDGRSIIAAVAADEQTFNLFEFSLAGTSRQLTRTTGGALWPDVSPDGKTVVFAGYTATGYDLFSIPYPAGPWDVGVAKKPAETNLASEAHRQVGAAPDAQAMTEYSPFPTLRPTSWTPIVESNADQLRAGASVSGYDVLGYHAYAASATWLVSSSADAPRPSAAAPDWQVAYVYGRWQPSFFMTAASDTSFFAGPATDAGAPTSATRRERQLEAGVLFPIRRTRVQHSAQISLARAMGDYTFTDGGASSRERTPLRLAWQTITAHTYGYSISREGGIAAGATVEIVRRGWGSSADATTTTGDLRAYLPGLAPHHVLALRLAGGVSTGDSTIGRTFLLGGADPGAGVVDRGSSAFSLLRGFRPDTFAGTHVGTINTDYRWPIARPQRGYGTWPLFVHSVHAAVFADAGHAWSNTFHAGAIKSSAGAQLSADLIAGYFTPLTATVGAAWGHDGSGRVADGVTLYFRVGKAF